MESGKTGAGDEVLSLENICFSNRYNDVLKNLNIRILSGEIHALLGENGSGKSILGKIMSGAVSPSSGLVRSAEGIAIGMIHQERVGNGDFRVWEYLFFDNDDAYHGFILPRRRVYRKSVDLLNKYGLEIDPDMLLRNLREAEYTAVELIRQIEKKPDILILDEVFIRLGTELTSLFAGIFMRLKRRGCAVVFITHDIERLYNFADRVSILRNGEILFSGNVDSIDKLNMIRLAYTETAQKACLAEVQSEFYHFFRFNEAILNTLPINLAVLDPDRKIIMANRSFEKHFNIERSVYLQKHISFIFSKQSNEVYKIILASLDSHETQSFFDVPLNIHGKESVNTLKIVPIYDGVSVVGHIIIVEDMTDYYNLQKKMMLSENLSSVGMLAAGVGHEINNSLEIVFNYLRFIKNRINESELSEPMEDLRTELDFIKKIVSRLVNFSDTNIVDEEEFDINDLIESYIKLIRRNDIYGSINFALMKKVDPLSLRMNRNELRQVIMNLIRNACEAAGSGGRITVSTSEETIDGKTSAVIAIEDDGPGIKAENLDSIFMPFYSTKTGNIKNLGLGLSLCYSIINKNGGTIKAENLPHRGCRLTVIMPFKDKAEETGRQISG